MAKGINIGIASETREFSQGVQRGVIEPLEDAADTLDDLAREGDRTGDKLGDSLKDGSREAEDSVEKLERGFRDLSDAAKAESKKAGDAIDQNVKRGTRGAEEGLDDFKDESQSVAKEAATSFDGSAESILDVFRDLAANAFIGFGPAGMGAGIAVAAGLGLAITAGMDTADAMNQAKERIGELTLELAEVDGDITRIDLGAKVREWGVEIGESVEFWEFWKDGAKSNLELAVEAADRYKQSHSEMLRAMSGYDSAAAERVLRSLTEQLEELREGARGSDDLEFVNRDELQRETIAMQDLIDKIERASGVTVEASESQQLLARATAEMTAEAEAAAAAEEARADAISALQGPIDDAIAGFDEFKDKESGALDPQAYLDGIAERIEATSNFNSNVATMAEQFNLSHDETQTILDQGLDFAPMLQAIIDSGLGAEFVGQIQAGVGGGQDILDGTPLTAVVEADVQPSEKSLRALMETDRETDPVKADADTRPAEKQLDRFTDRRRSTTISVRADTAAAEAAISRLINRARNITVTARVVDRFGRPVI